MSDCNEQRFWLDKIRQMEVTDFPFKLCLAQPSGRPGLWVDWNRWNWNERPLAQFRTLCQNELLLDFDMDDPLEMFFTAHTFEQRLKSMKIPYYVYDSGGKGYHFQIWLETERTDIDWQVLRGKLVRHLTHGILYRTKIGDNWHWNIDPRKWNWDARGAGSVVRATGARKKYVNYMIEGVLSPDQRKRKTRPVFPPHDFAFKKWKVPVEFERESEVRERPKVADIKLDEDVPICVEALIEQEMTGVHLNHAQRVVLVAHVWKSWKSKHPTERMPETEMARIHQVFVNDPVYDYGQTDYQIRNIVNAMEAEPAKVPGCRYMRDGLIDSEFCSICRVVKR